MFFTNPQLFLKELRSKKPTSDACWSCSYDFLIMRFQVADHFADLRISAKKCGPTIMLCPRCAVEYINSLATAAHPNTISCGLHTDKEENQKMTLPNYLEMVYELIEEKKAAQQKNSWHGLDVY
jgi:hypothetical protein